jgi:hypothetical protein
MDWHAKTRSAHRSAFDVFIFLDTTDPTFAQSPVIPREYGAIDIKKRNVRTEYLKYQSSFLKMSD